jgi:hypothetical protein
MIFMQKVKLRKLRLTVFAFCVTVIKMKLSSFAKEVRKWRGKRGQKEVADLCGWNLRTYEGWENGRAPSRFRINELRRQMAEHPENKTP